MPHCGRGAPERRASGAGRQAGRWREGEGGEAARIGFEAHNVHEHRNRRSARLGPRRATRAPPRQVRRHVAGEGQRGGGGAEAGAQGLRPVFPTGSRPVACLEIATTRATRRPSQSPGTGARARPPGTGWRELGMSRGGSGDRKAVVTSLLLSGFWRRSAARGCGAARARRGMRRQRRPGVTVRRRLLAAHVLQREESEDQLATRRRRRPGRAGRPSAAAGPAGPRMGASREPAARPHRAASVGNAVAASSARGRRTLHGGGRAHCHAPAKVLVLCPARRGDASTRRASAPPARCGRHGTAHSNAWPRGPPCAVVVTAALQLRGARTLFGIAALRPRRLVHKVPLCLAAHRCFRP